MKHTKRSLAALALAGLGLGLGACDSSETTAAPTAPSKAMGITAQMDSSFTKACHDSGKVTFHTSCNGTSRCNGLFLDAATGMASPLECRGHNTCKGIQCIPEASAKMP
jgi:hypothetical protein